MAVSSEVGIYNLALNAVGERSNISLPTENSRQAEVCNLWYETVRDQILEAAFWPEASKIERLAQLSEQDDNVWDVGEARLGYTYLYAIPSDCLRPRYLDHFDRFWLSDNSGQRALHTNRESAVLVYTRKLETVSLWSTSLRMAVAYGLASHICMPLSGKPSRAQVLADKANELIFNARVNAANSTDETFETIPDWFKARGYGMSGTTRYIYPKGDLLTVTNVN